MATASLTRRRANSVLRGLRLTQRNLRLLLAFWEIREMTAVQVKALAFPNLSDTVYQRRRLTLLKTTRFSVRVRVALALEVGVLSLPICTATSGRRSSSTRASCLTESRPAPDPPGSASCGVAGIAKASPTSMWPCGGVAKISAIRSAWQGEADLGNIGASSGAPIPIRPDGFFTIDVTGRGGLLFWSFSTSSSPKEYRAKVRAYGAYWESGAYTAWSGFTAPFRVLGVAGSTARVGHLAKAAEDEACGDLADLFWCTTLSAVKRNPLMRSGPSRMGGGHRSHFCPHV